MSETDTPTEVFWNRMTAETLRNKAAEEALVILPVASTEQHGPHLGTGVDTFLCTEVCRRAALRIAEHRPVVVAPTVWMGLAEHHVALGGTFTLSLNTWHSLLHDLCEAILRAEFRNIVIVNGHGGNMAALTALTTDLTRDLGVPIASTTYWTLAAEAGEVAPILEDQESLIHACEAETSMMMAAHGDLVDHSRLEDAVGPTTGMAELLSPAVMRWRSFAEISPSGVVGDARRATAEKGEKLFNVMAEKLADAFLAGRPWST